VIKIKSMMPILVSVAVVASASSVQAAGTLYQWVDSTGRVVYGDSPPTVTHTRRVDDHQSPNLLRDLPPALVSGAPTRVADAQPPETANAQPDSEAQLSEMMAKLNAALEQVEALTAENAESTAPATVATTATDVGRSDLANAANALLGGAAASNSQVSQADTAGASAPAVSAVAAVDAPATGVPDIARQPETVNSSVVVAQPVEVTLETDDIGGSEQVVASVADAPPVLGTEPPIEVAVASPQPIESRMSEKDRARARWRRENLGEMRFLNRLSQTQSGAVVPAKAD
jgi:hypothetical protein